MNLVTGPTGHIGNVLVRTLLSSGEKVRVLVQPNDDLSPLEGLAVEVVEGDILDAQALFQAFEGVENVYHLAGLISIMPGRDALVHQVNVLGTRNVLFAAQQQDIKRLVYTSSIHALPRAPHGVTIDESLPYDPENAISAYDQSKALASLAVQEAAQQGLNAVIVCPTGVIGPYDFRGSEMGALIRDAVERKPMLYVEGAYDFVDVRDVAQGIILARDQGQSGESYILSGEQLSVPDLIETLWELTGRSFLRMKIPSAVAHFVSRFTPHYYRIARAQPRITPYSLETLWGNSVISHAKAARELGYQPRPLKESLADTVQWFRQRSRHSSIR